LYGFFAQNLFEERIFAPHSFLALESISQNRRESMIKSLSLPALRAVIDFTRLFCDFSAVLFWARNSFGEQKSMSNV
jgi:hypothetical protein